MNAAALIELLHARAAEHYAARSRPGIVKVVVVSAQASAQALFELGRGFNSAPAGASPDATLSITDAALATILATPSSFDPRAPGLAAQLAFDGDPRLMQYLLQLLKRPTPTASARLDKARRIAPDDLGAVPEHHLIDPRTVLKTLAESRPLCLRGVLDWPAIGWDFDELAARHGDVMLRHNPQSGRSESLREFVDAVRHPPCASSVAAPYTDGAALPDALRELFPFPLFADGVFSPPQLWCGAKRTDALVTRLHCDLMTSFLAQVRGRKRVRLFSPSQHPRLYALNAFNHYQPCLVDAAHPDLTRFPLFAQARALDVVIGPGDLLIVPTGWYHCVWALDDVLSVSRFLDDSVAGELRAMQAAAPAPVLA
jgi:hypothetical protein